MLCSVQGVLCWWGKIIVDKFFPPQKLFWVFKMFYTCDQWKSGITFERWNFSTMTSLYQRKNKEHCRHVCLLSKYLETLFWHLYYIHTTINGIIMSIILMIFHIFLTELSISSDDSILIVSFASVGSESPCSFTADTLNLYSRPFIRPFASKELPWALPQAIQQPRSNSNRSIY